MARKRLLIIGGGVEQVRAYELAREMGHEVVGTDQDTGAPALALADHALRASTRDVGETLAALEPFHATRPIDGVMTIANDVPRTIAAVAARLGLPGIPESAAALAADKLAMKEAFVSAGVATPPGEAVGSLAELRRVVEATPGRLVLKPVDGRGARGVLQLGPSIDLAAAFAEAMSHSARGLCLVERFVPGLQLSTESFVLDGVAHTPAVSERNYEHLERFAPHIIENGGTIPAALAPETRRAVGGLVTAAARALGIRGGPVKGDVVLGPGGPVVIEIAARLSGGYFCTDQIPLATGVDLVRATIRWALGERVSAAALQPTRDRATAIRYFFPPPGRIRAIHGFESLREPWVRKRLLFCQVGDRVWTTTDHTRRVGFVLVDGENRAQVLARVAEAVGRVRFDMAPEGNG